MRNRRLILIAGLIGLLTAATLLYFGFHDAPRELAARRHLNDLLGQANANEPEQEPGQEPEGFPAFPSLPPGNDNLFFGLPMPTTEVDVEETASSYVLRVPLASPEDSDSVKLNVNPHRIEVSGQTGSKEGSSSMTSSFMQSFSTSQEVLPDQVQRSTEQNGDRTELVITIPKKTSGEVLSTPNEYPELNDEPPREGSPPMLEPPPENNGSPIDTFSNRVI